MDRRVTTLIEDMQAGRISRPDGSFDPEALADRIVALHAEVEDEESRVELIALYNALMSTGEKGLIAEGRDPAPLREVWRRTYFSFLLAESLTDGEVEAEKLARINAREIAAGRLHPDDSVQIRRVDPSPPAEPPPAAQPARLRSGGISQDDYPSGALRRGEEGGVTVGFVAGADGRVKDIRVTASSGSAELDEATCRLIERRFRYAPALDSEGEPVPQRVVQTVTWQLDEADRPAPEPKPGALKSIARGVSRLFGKGAASPPPPSVPDEPPPASASDSPSALERAYRAIFLWEEERMGPRIEGLAEEFRARLAALEPEPGESFRAAAERETLTIARPFEANVEEFLREAVSYLDDDVIRGREALGVAEQFHKVIFEAIDEARADLARRMADIREAACAGVALEK